MLANEENIILDQTFRLNSGMYSIVDINAKQSPFKLNRAQAHFNANIHPLSIILKSRRLGFTTYSGLRGLDTVLFNPNTKSLFISYDDDSAQEVFRDLILYAWEQLDPSIKDLYKVDQSNAKTLRFDFQDGTYSSIQVKTSGRGSGYQYIHISELARIAAKFPNKAQEIFSGTIPAVAPNGHIVIESTAEGPSGLFHDTFMEAYRHIAIDPDYQPTEKEWKPFFYNWQWDSQIKHHTLEIPATHTDRKRFLEYQKQHNEKAKKNKQLLPITDQELAFWFYKYVQSGYKWHTLLENYPTTPEEAFSTTQKKYFKHNQIENAKSTVRQPLSFDFESDWVIYEPPNPRSTYILGADPSEGVGKDHSAIVILDISTPKPRVVATFTSNSDNPYELADIIVNKALFYNSAFVSVERNNTGHGTLGILKDKYPPYLIYHEEDHIKELSTTKERLGWVTTGNSKKIMLGTLKDYLEDDQIVISSKELANEIALYDTETANKRKITDPDATNHYDLLMALTVALVTISSATSTSESFETVSPHRQKATNPFYS